MKINKICCFGAGYVGGPTMAVIAKMNPNIKVTIVDINAERIAALNDNDISKLSIYEPGLGKIVEETRVKNLFFSTEIDKAIYESEMIFISISAPTKAYGKGKGMASDLKYVELCARNIAEVAKTDKIVIEKSTLPVITAQAIKTILHNTGGTVKFSILSNPEFLAERTSIQDLLNPDRVLIVDESEDAIEILANIYAPWVSQDRILRTNVWSSELSKLTANVFLAQLISSINAISELCEHTEAGVNEVARAVGMDSRIESKFLNASIGFGDSCFQKDTNDTRDSAAIFVSDHLLNEQAHMAVYDPKVSENKVHADLNYLNTRAEKENNDLVENLEEPYEALNDAYAVAIMTEWNEFKTYDWIRIYKGMKKPAFIFDGGNLLDKKEMTHIGSEYSSIGK